MFSQNFLTCCLLLCALFGHCQQEACQGSQCIKVESDVTTLLMNKAKVAPVELHEETSLFQMKMAISKTTAAAIGPDADLDLCAGGVAQVHSKLSSDIPLVKTPNVNGTCGWQTYAPPVLAECTEPLAPGVPDLRGFWTGFMGKNITMRHEQCGDRVAVAGESNGLYMMRDLLHVDGTYQHGINDYTASAMPMCAPLVAAGVFQGNCLHFLLQNMGGRISVSRCAQPNGTMVFDPTGMGGPGGSIFTRTKTTTVTCQQLQDFYEANECGGMPDKVAKEDMDSFSLCDFVHNNVTCGDIKHHYTANTCCGSPQKIVNKPAWCSYKPS